MDIRRSYATVVGYAFLGLAAVASFYLPQSLGPAKATAAPPAELQLTGIVRDFSRTHPDFDVAPVDGFGHVAGAVETTIVSSAGPVATGAGRRVDTQWLDDDGRPIAPHMLDIFDASDFAYCYGNRPGIAVDGQVTIDNQGMVDSFDSSLGPYGGANVGAYALVSTNSTSSGMLINENSSDIFGNMYYGPGGKRSSIYSEHPNSTLSGSVNELDSTIPMPTVTAPWLPNSGDLVVAGGTTMVISTDMRVRELIVEPDATLQIKGAVTIVVDRELQIQDLVYRDKGVTIEEFGSIELMAGATLDIYIKGNRASLIAGELNYNTGDPNRCTISLVDDAELYLRRRRCKCVANVIAPNGTMHIGQGAEMFGTFVGQSIDIDNTASFHVDLGFEGDYVFPPDAAGAWGDNSSGGVTSSATFDQWFDDALGVNVAAPHTITLIRGFDGVYEFSAGEFHPADDKLYGNDSDAHNFFFTYVIDARFTYSSCAGQMVEFQGSDEAWIVIDDRLVIDLGGVHASTSQYHDLDRLGLEEGREYRFRLYYAQRQDQWTDFSLRTTLELSTDHVLPSMTASFD